MGVVAGKVALVTGGGSGIGLATASRLSAEGARIVIADRDESLGLQAAKATGGHFVKADVGDPEAWPRIVAEAEEGFDGIDIAHLNAGVITGEADITQLTDDQYRRIAAANMDGVVFGVRAVVPVIERRGGGAIVVTASLAGLIAYAPDPIYGLTKHAVVGLVRALAPQLSAKGVTINSVCPGLVDTPMIREGKALLEEAGFPMIPPGDIADAVLRLVTGQETGGAWVCQAGREPVAYSFRRVPGPRLAGAEGRLPPPQLAGADQDPGAAR